MASLASITAHLHVSVGDNEPVELAEFQVPLEVQVSPFSATDSITVSSGNVRENIAAALLEAAARIRRDL